MASGLPCVGSAVGGIPETIEDNVTGLLVPPGQDEPLAAAVARLLDDAPLRTRMGHAARQRAQAKFTWRVLSGEVANVYREVVGSLPTTRGV